MSDKYPIGTKIRILETSNAASCHCFYHPNDIGVVVEVDETDRDLLVDFDNQGNPEIFTQKGENKWYVPTIGLDGQSFEGIDFEVVTGTPLGGRATKEPDRCCIEISGGECGCAFGQCVKGLIV